MSERRACPATLSSRPQRCRCQRRLPLRPEELFSVPAHSGRLLGPGRVPGCPQKGRSLLWAHGPATPPLRRPRLRLGPPEPVPQLLPETARHGGHSACSTSLKEGDQERTALPQGLNAKAFGQPPPPRSPRHWHPSGPLPRPEFTRGRLPVLWTVQVPLCGCGATTFTSEIIPSAPDDNTVVLTEGK